LEPEPVDRLRKQPEDNLHPEEGGQRHQPQPERWRSLWREEQNRKNGDKPAGFAGATGNCESRIVDGLNCQESIFVNRLKEWNMSLSAPGMLTLMPIAVSWGFPRLRPTN
jgi:hypothetical protein